jgi:hypothetical protein
LIITEVRLSLFSAIDLLNHRPGIFLSRR